MKTALTKSKVTAPVVLSTYFTHQCASCDGKSKSVRRDFSDQAWAALVAWSEVNPKAVDGPLCNDCYFNFRDVLIERADEMRLISVNVAANAKVATGRRATNKVARA